MGKPEAMILVIISVKGNLCPVIRFFGYLLVCNLYVPVLLYIYIVITVGFLSSVNFEFSTFFYSLFEFSLIIPDELRQDYRQFTTFGAISDPHLEKMLVQYHSSFVILEYKKFLPIYQYYFIKN